jgi:DinB superfamily
MTRRSTSLAGWRRQAIRRIEAVRRSTLAFVATLPEAELRRPRTLDRWSVKDVLGHLMSCDEETVRRFRLIARGRGTDIHWFESMADAHRFNARTVGRSRRLSLPALRRRMARAHAAVIAWLGRLPVEALRDPSHTYPVVEWLPTPGWSHERDHLSEVKAWWRDHRRRSVRRPPPRTRG